MCWLRSLYPILAIAVLLTATTQTFAKEICNSLPTPPSEIGGMRLSGFKNFDDKELGIVARYQSLDEHVSLFKFDYGLETIDDGILDKFFKIAIKDIYAAARRHSENLENASELGTVQFLGRGMRNFMAHGGKLTSIKFEFLGMSHDGECMTKIRYTYDRNTNAADRDTDAADAMRRYVTHFIWLEKFLRQE